MRVHSDIERCDQPRPSLARCHWTRRRTINPKVNWNFSLPRRNFGLSHTLTDSPRCEIELMLSLSAFCRFATSSVIRTTVGSFRLLSPRVAGCINDICALYYAVALWIPVHSLSQSFLLVKRLLTSVITIIWALSIFANNCCFSTSRNVKIEPERKDID